MSQRRRFGRHKRKVNTDYIIDERGWFCEVGEPYPEETEEEIVEPVKVRKRRDCRCANPKQVSSSLNEEEQAAFERLMSHYGLNSAGTIRRIILDWDRVLRVSRGDRYEDFI